MSGVLQTIVVVERDQRSLRPDEPLKFNVTLDDETVVSRSRDPEHDTCRALLARGITGQVAFRQKATGIIGMTMSIEWGADHAVYESDRGLRVQKYRPYPATGSSPASETPADPPIASSANEKGPASAATDPDHGSITSLERKKL